MNKNATITFLAAAICLAAVGNVSAFSSKELNRRESLQALVGGVATAVIPAVVPQIANALPSDETPRVVTRMGGLLVCGLDECFEDGVTGFCSAVGWQRLCPREMI